jgi:hypothetical protein
MVDRMLPLSFVVPTGWQEPSGALVCVVLRPLLRVAFENFKIGFAGARCFVRDIPSRSRGFRISIVIYFVRSQ